MDLILVNDFFETSCIGHLEKLFLELFRSYHGYFHELSHGLIGIPFLQGWHLLIMLFNSVEKSLILEIEGQMEKFFHFKSSILSLAAINIVSTCPETTSSISSFLKKCY